MCERYTLTIDRSTIEKRFGGRFCIAQAEYEPTFNAAPPQLLPIIRTGSQDRIELARWGFVPEHWASSPRMTCPLSCAFRKGNGTSTAGVCYAEHGALAATCGLCSIARPPVSRS